MDKKDDTQPYYKGDAVMVLIERYQLNFPLGNAVKYILRAGKKSPDRLPDYKKAVWYLKRDLSRWPAINNDVYDFGNRSDVAEDLGSYSIKFELDGEDEQAFVDIMLSTFKGEKGRVNNAITILEDKIRILEDNRDEMRRT